MTIEAAIIAKFDRDGWPLSLVKLVNDNPGRSIENIIREWLTTNSPED